MKGDSMFSKFTEEARKVLIGAKKEILLIPDTAMI